MLCLQLRDLGPEHTFISLICLFQNNHILLMLLPFRIYVFKNLLQSQVWNAHKHMHSKQLNSFMVGTDFPTHFTKLDCLLSSKVALNYFCCFLKIKSTLYAFLIITSFSQKLNTYLFCYQKCKIIICTVLYILEKLISLQS